MRRQVRQAAYDLVHRQIGDEREGNAASVRLELPARVGNPRTLGGRRPGGYEHALGIGVNREGEIQRVAVVTRHGDAGDVRRQRPPVDCGGIDRSEHNRRRRKQLAASRAQEIERERADDHDQVDAAAGVLGSQELHHLLLVLLAWKAQQVEVFRVEVHRMRELARQRRAQRRFELRVDRALVRVEHQHMLADGPLGRHRARGPGRHDTDEDHHADGEPEPRMPRTGGVVGRHRM